MVFYMIFQFSGAIKNGSMSYFCRWVLDSSSPDAWGTYQSILAIMGAIPMAVAMLFVNPLCQKFGKRNTVSAFLVLGVAGGVIAILGGDNIVPVAAGVALKCLGSSPACYMILWRCWRMSSTILNGRRGFGPTGLRCPSTAPSWSPHPLS